MELLPYESMVTALREKRRRLNIQQKTVARYADISPAYLSRIENAATHANYTTIYDIWHVLEREADAELETAADLMTTTIAWVTVDDTVRDARRCMLENDYSQLPVQDGNTLAGSVSERTLLEDTDPEQAIGEVIDPPFLEVAPTTGRDAVSALLSDGNTALLVTDPNDYHGIITPMDLI